MIRLLDKTIFDPSKPELAKVNQKNSERSKINSNLLVSNFIKKACDIKECEIKCIDSAAISFTLWDSEKFGKWELKGNHLVAYENIGSLIKSLSNPLKEKTKQESNNDSEANSMIVFEDKPLEELILPQTRSMKQPAFVCVTKQAKCNTI